jgi:hypothetical protein
MISTCAVEFGIGKKLITNGTNERITRIFTYFATIQPSCPNVFIGHPQQARTMDSRLKRAGMTGNTSRLNSYPIFSFSFVLFVYSCHS